MTTKIILGVDFDNTIVNYDRVFRMVALELGLILAEFEGGKEDVKRRLYAEGKKDEWTALQGHVYGRRMGEADPFPQSLDCLSEWIRKGVRVFVVSHKTRHPYIGRSYDLHSAAWGWLEMMGFFDQDCINMQKQDIFLELTKQDKINRISSLNCTHFIDDLPDLLMDPSFPSSTERILFDPGLKNPEIMEIQKIPSWQKLNEYIENLLDHANG